MNKALLIVLCLIGGITFGQSTVFLKSYGSGGFDVGRDIKQTLDTGYIATGSSSSFGSETADAFLMKIDSVGTFKWSYNYGGTGSDWGEKVILTKDSAFALAGHTNSFGAGGFDFYLVRTTIEGEPVWEQTYGGTNWDKAYSLIQLPDSGFALVGETYSFGEGERDVYIVRTDKNGEELWSTTWGGTLDDWATDVDIHNDSLVISGITNSFGAGSSDGIVLKYHMDDGALGSTFIIGQAGEDGFNSIIQKDTFYLMGGYRSYNHYEDCDCGKDFWIYKIDTADFSVIADTTWNGEQLGSDIIYDVCLSANNDMFYAATTTSWGSVDIIDGYTDAFFGKFLNNYYTDFTYVKNFGEQGNDDLRGTDYCYDKGVVAVGTSPFGSLGSSNIIVIRNDRFNSGSGTTVYDMEFDIVTLSIDEDVNETLDDFLVYPTVFSQQVFIQGLPSVENDFIVYDMKGRMNYQDMNSTANQLELGTLPSGYYILKIISEQWTYTRKLVKQ